VHVYIRGHYDDVHENEYIPPFPDSIIGTCSTVKVLPQETRKTVLSLETAKLSDFFQKLVFLGALR